MMRIWIAALLVACSSVAAEAFEFPQTRPGEVARAYLESLNSGDLTAMVAFARDYRSEAELANRSPEERAARTMNLHQQVGVLEPAAVTEETPHSITLTVHAQKVDMWLSCAFELQTEAPHRLQQVKIMPTTPPGEAVQREPLDWDNIEWRDLTDLLEQVRAHANIPALAAGIIENGEVTTSVVGVREAGTTSPVATHDRFHVGSIGKSMTATLIGRLVETEVLDWDTTVQSVLQDVSMQSAYGDATLEELLQHRAGLPGFQTFDDTDEQRLNPQGASPTERRALFLREALLSEPLGPRGSMAYSNAGYVVAGTMAEVATGTSWEELMQQHVLVPLGLEHTGFGMPATRSRPNQPREHEQRQGKYVALELAEDYPLDAFIAPAGNVHASIDDLARYAAAHLNGLLGQDGVLGAKTMSRLHAVPGGESTGYAAGWMIEESAHGPVHTHAGSAGTFFAIVSLFPQQRRAVVVAMNVGPEGMALAEELTQALMQRSTEAAQGSARSSR